MTAQCTSASPAGSDEPPVTSRRNLVAASTTAVMPTGAEAPTRAPEQSHYSQLAEVNGHQRIVFLAGQPGRMRTAKSWQGIRGQACPNPGEHKDQPRLGDGSERYRQAQQLHARLDRDGPAYREVRASYFSNKPALPALTLLQVSRLATPEYLLQVEALAILSPKA